MATTKVKRSVHRAQPPHRTHSINRSSKPSKPAPGSFSLLKRTLPGRQFVEFPQARGKTTEKIEFFTIWEYHSLTIDFQDHTSLNLAIEPGFTLNAELHERRKGETHVLAKWPPIRSQR